MGEDINAWVLEELKEIKGALRKLSVQIEDLNRRVLEIGNATSLIEEHEAALEQEIRPDSAEADREVGG